MIPIIGDAIRAVAGIVSEVIPDADKRDQIKVEMAKLADQADAREFELMKGQIEVNKEEAKNANLFVAGWRPAIGWIGGAALAWTWILAPFIKFGFDATGHPDLPMPALSPDAIYPIIFGMLGIGAMRTVEKMSGVATSVNGAVLIPQHKQENPAVVEGGPISKAASAIGRWIK
jgi:holin (3TMs family)